MATVPNAETFRLNAAGCLLGCVAALFSEAVLARPTVIITVDVESTSSLRLPNQVDPVCSDGSRCGLMEVVRMLNDRGQSGTFFLNVYEHTWFGKDLMRNLAVELEQAGQDVELHTHPETVYDPTRWAMFDYNLTEQTEIVRDGIQLLTDWTGKPVVAHRAGAYAANEDTLRALEANGVLLDSSMFWGHRNSHLDQLGLPRNLPSQHGALTEIPVTVYRRDDRPTGLGAFLKPTSVIRKVDIDWFSNADEARSVIYALVNADVPAIVVFLHSFSLMAEDASDGEAIADPQSLAILRAVLDTIAAENLPTRSLRQIAAEPLPLATTQDYVPAVTLDVDLLHYLVRRVKGTEPLSLVLTGAAFCVLAGALVLLLRNVTRRFVGGGRHRNA